MRYLLHILVFTLSNLAMGQNVLTKFEEVVANEDFSNSNFIFSQKFNANELFVIENGAYRMQRRSEDYYSISYARIDEPLEQHSVSAKIELIKNKNKNASCGIVMHSQLDGSGAIVLEMNCKRRFRVRKLFNEQEKWLTVSDDEGWIKSKLLNKKGVNKLELRAAKGYYDIYINDTYVYTVFDLQFSTGRAGLFVNGNSECSTSQFTVMREKNKIQVKEPGDTASSGSDEPSFQDVILIFKTKIDQQQEQIAQLQGELDKCKSMLTYDTALVSQSAQLRSENARMTVLLDSISKELNKAKKRLEYLESFKEDVEAASNGDLVLNLTNILAQLKTDNKNLEKEITSLKANNAELKRENEVLLREVERLRKLQELQDPGE
ncbi:hypothetical protein GYB22_03065 [bacterium]|nr:hypothetical protein [bacterium]